MTVRERLDELLDLLPEERAQEVLDFAEFLAARRTDDLDSWREALRHSTARRYGEDEPEYTLSDIKQR